MTAFALPRVSQALRQPSATLRPVDAEPSDLERQREQWQRRQRLLRRAQDFGLLLLTLGVLVLVYVALLANSQ